MRRDYIIIIINSDVRPVANRPSSRRFEPIWKFVEYLGD